MTRENEFPDEFPDEFEDDEAEDEHEPTLGLIGRFTFSLARVPWFIHTGAPLDQALRADARNYLDALGFPDVTVTRIGSWADAGAAAESLDWDSPGWEVEEQLRAGLTNAAVERLGADTLEVAMTHVASRAAPAIEAALTHLAPLWEITDESLLNAALGSGVQAAHQAALVLAAGESDHPFALKFRMFEQGRWPIGVAGLSYNIL